MRIFLLASLLFCACGSQDPDQSDLTATSDRSPFPSAPHSELTQGELCTKPKEYRYPERIPYCGRSVSSEKKKQVIEAYEALTYIDEDNEEHQVYDILAYGRENFKIDHFIPLCMGGNNEPNNLWPQHESLYRHTDRLEERLCLVMANDKMRQAEAVVWIKRAKFDLSLVEGMLEQLEALLKKNS